MSKKLIVFLWSLISLSFLSEKSNIEPDRKVYPIKGIDISKHSGNINWYKLAKQNIDFIYIKCTEGGDYLDPLFRSHYFNAQNFNFPTGVYHFYRFEKSGTEQANNFLKHLPKNYKQQLPPVIDIEDYDEKNPANLPAREIITGIKTFIKKIVNKTGHKPIIYSNKHTMTVLLKDHFKSYSIWMSIVSSEPKGKWLFWQYGLNYRLKSIEGSVDLNTFNGNRQQWKNYLNKYGLKMKKHTSTKE